MAKVKLDQRVKFPNGNQKRFLKQALFSLNMKKFELARIANVCPRTLSDWKRENIIWDSLP